MQSPQRVQPDKKWNSSIAPGGRKTGNTRDTDPRPKLVAGTGSMLIPAMLRGFTSGGRDSFDPGNFVGYRMTRGGNLSDGMNFHSRPCSKSRRLGFVFGDAAQTFHAASGSLTIAERSRQNAESNRAERLPTMIVIAPGRHLIPWNRHRAAVTSVRHRTPAFDRAWPKGRGTERNWFAMGAWTPFPPIRSARRGKHCSSRASIASAEWLVVRLGMLAFLIWALASRQSSIQRSHRAIETVQEPWSRDTGRNSPGKHETSRWPSSLLSSHRQSGMRNRLHRSCFRPGGE